MNRIGTFCLVRCSVLVGLAALLPACQGSSTSAGAGNADGILWNSNSTGAPVQGGNGNGGSLWVDPNSGLGATPPGINNIITSADDATYASFTPDNGTTGTLGQPTISYIRNLEHPLSTDTSSMEITSRESTLEGMINGYRQQQLGNMGIDPGLLGVGGFAQGVILPSHFQGTKCARAHCKHYALFHSGPPPVGPNFEGDDLLTTLTNSDAYTQGTPPPGNPLGLFGRLGKIGVSAADGTQLVVSGNTFSEAQDAFNVLITNSPGTLTANWTNVAVGHWRGGTNNVYSWNIIFLTNPNPSD